MIKIKQFLTEGTTIKISALISLYIPGVALLIWFYVFALGEIFSDFVLTFGVESRFLYTTLLFSLIIASVVAGEIIDKTGKSRSFTYAGLGFCGIISLLSFFINSASQLVAYSILVGTGAGIGLTGLRVYLADLTEVEERGRVTGALLFLFYISIVFLKLLLKNASAKFSIVFLSLVCLGGCLAYFVRPNEILTNKKVGVYGRTLYYFFISWLLFAGAYGTWNAMVTPHPISLVSTMNNAAFGIIVALGYGFGAIVAGASIDWIGRRIVLGFALAILAIAYLLYGLFHFYSYFALFLEVISWGLINTIFIFVIWGEVTKEHKGLFYGVALSILFGGFLLGELLAYIFGPVPWSYVSVLSSAMLILAIVPLVYADEPLPKEKVKLREMASYMKEIRKITKL